MAGSRTHDPASDYDDVVDIDALAQQLISKTCSLTSVEATLRQLSNEDRTLLFERLGKRNALLDNILRCSIAAPSGGSSTASANCQSTSTTATITHVGGAPRRGPSGAARGSPLSSATAFAPRSSRNASPACAGDAVHRSRGAAVDHPSRSPTNSARSATATSVTSSAVNTGSTVETLHLQSCYALRKATLISIGKSCPKLHYINLSGCPQVENKIVEQLLRHCGNLRTLILDDVRRVTDAAFCRVHPREIARGTHQHGDAAKGEGIAGAEVENEMKKELGDAVALRTPSAAGTTTGGAMSLTGNVPEERSSPRMPKNSVETPVTSSKLGIRGGRSRVGGDEESPSPLGRLQFLDRESAANPTDSKKQAPFSQAAVGAAETGESTTTGSASVSEMVSRDRSAACSPALGAAGGASTEVKHNRTMQHRMPGQTQNNGRLAKERTLLLPVPVLPAERLLAGANSTCTTSTTTSKSSSSCSSGLANLRELSLCRNPQISAAGVQHILRRAKQLRSLKLSGCNLHLTENLLCLIFGKKKRPFMQIVDLSYLQGPVGGFEYLEMGTNQIRELNLSHTNLSDSGVRRIVGGCEMLEKLFVSWCGQVSDAGFFCAGVAGGATGSVATASSASASAPLPSTPRKVGAGGAVQQVGTPRIACRRLKLLDLSGTRITDETLRHFAFRLPVLAELDISWCPNIKLSQVYFDEAEFMQEQGEDQDVTRVLALGQNSNSTAASTSRGQTVIPAGLASRVAAADGSLHAEAEAGVVSRHRPLLRKSSSSVCLTEGAKNHSRVVEAPHQPPEEENVLTADNHRRGSIDLTAGTGELDLTGWQRSSSISSSRSSSARPRRTSQPGKRGATASAHMSSQHRGEGTAAQLPRQAHLLVEDARENNAAEEGRAGTGCSVGGRSPRSPIVIPKVPSNDHGAGGAAASKNFTATVASTNSSTSHSNVNTTGILCTASECAFPSRGLETLSLAGLWNLERAISSVSPERTLGLSSALKTLRLDSIEVGASVLRAISRCRNLESLGLQLQMNAGLAPLQQICEETVSVVPASPTSDTFHNGAANETCENPFMTVARNCDKIHTLSLDCARTQPSLLVEPLAKGFPLLKGLRVRCAFFDNDLERILRNRSLLEQLQLEDVNLADDTLLRWCRGTWGGASEQEGAGGAASGGEADPCVIGPPEVMLRKTSSSSCCEEAGGDEDDELSFEDQEDDAGQGARGTSEDVACSGAFLPNLLTFTAKAHQLTDVGAKALAEMLQGSVLTVELDSPFLTKNAIQPFVELAQFLRRVQVFATGVDGGGRNFTWSGDKKRDSEKKMLQKKRLEVLKEASGSEMEYSD